jgi:hypothetical protein
VSLLPACATSGSATQDAALKACLLRASRGLLAGTGYIQILKRARLGNFIEPAVNPCVGQANKSARTRPA